MFEGVIGQTVFGDIAIDDVFIDTSSACRPTASCSFEDSLCLWSQLPTNEFNLLRITPQQLQTLSINQNQNTIQADTTTNTKYGHFLWVNPSYYPQIQANKTTSIVSETLFTVNYMNGACLTFSYILNGNNPGILNVYRKFIALPTKSLLYSLHGNQGNDWKQASISLSPAGENYELYLEVLIGDTYGNIAIDDIFLYDEICASLPTTPNPLDLFKCNDGSVVHISNVCNFIKDCPDGEDEKICADCDFENSTCQYLDRSLGEINWARTQALAAPNGPSIDNTLKTKYGHFVSLVENNLLNSYDYASLELDQMLKPCSPTCELEFYYHMFGKSDDLIVYIISETGKTTELVELSGDFGDKWNRYLLPIGRVSKSFKLEFEGTRYGYDSEFDLAIDDIRLINCEFPTPRPTCPANYFTCQRKACIAMNKVCDLVDDCGDNSDELNCQGYTACDFENGLCDWQNDPNADIKWILYRGQTPSFGTGILFISFIEFSSFLTLFSKKGKFTDKLN